MKYLDQRLRLIGIPLIVLFMVHLGRDGTLLELLSNKDNYYFDLLFSFVITFGSWQVTRYTIVRFDQSMSWEENLLKRAFLQLTITLSVSASLLLGTAMIYAALLGIPYEWIMAPDVELPVGLLFVTILNLLYYLMYLQKSNKDTEHELAHQKNQKPKVILALHGTEHIRLLSSEVSYFHSKNKVVFVSLQNGSIYRTNYTLNEVEKMLSPEFYRLNRQLMVSRQGVLGYRSIENRKLEVTLAPPFQEDATVSQLKTKEFKDWFKN